MSAAEVDALIDAGLARCATCRHWDEPSRMRFSCDGANWYCATAADGLPPCAEEKRPCKDCGLLVVVLDLDMDGKCELHETRAA